MSVRHSLLALLAQAPSYGYQLKAEFERRTASTWPVNVGQVYNTLDRLERDGMVEQAGVDSDGHVFYEITDTGRVEALAWLTGPVPRSTTTRDELAVKLALAVTLPGVDPAAIIQSQRVATLSLLQQLTRSKIAGSDQDTAEGLAWQLVVDALIFQAEAEIRWLDHSESRISRLRAKGLTTDHGFADPAPRGRPPKQPTTSTSNDATTPGAGR